MCIPYSQVTIYWRVYTRYTQVIIQGIHRVCTGYIMGVHRLYTGYVQGINWVFTESLQGKLLIRGILIQIRRHCRTCFQVSPWPGRVPSAAENIYEILPLRTPGHQTA